MDIDKLIIIATITTMKKGDSNRSGFMKKHLAATIIMIVYVNNFSQ